MVASHTPLLGDTFAFDGMQLFLLKRLEDKITYVKSTRSIDNQEFEITIMLTNELEPNQCYQLYNIIFKKILRLMKLKQIGRHYFNPALSNSIPQHNMELWPGYITAIGQHDGGSMLNIDLANKVLRTDTVLDHINNLKAKSGQHFQETVKMYLIGQVVLTRYNNKTYHIDDVAFDLSPNSTFKKSTGESVSYVQYYKDNYNKVIKDVGQPLLIHKSKKKFKGGQRGGEKEEETIYLVPELCCMTGFTDEIRADFKIMKDLAQYTIVPPEVRKNSLEKFIQECYNNPEISSELKKWNIEFSKTLLSFRTRVLNPEPIFFTEQKKIPGQQNAEWSREMKQITLTQCQHLQHWAVICPNKIGQTAQTFIQTMMKVGPPLGIKIANPTPVPLDRDSPTDYINAIREIYNRNPQNQLVVCILPDTRKDRYDGIKKFCVADTGIVSQCVLAKTINNEKISVSACTKIIMQMNVKLGGQLWTVQIPLEKTMVVGMDVYHDSLQKGTSVVGFCASMNPSMTKYYSRVVFQRARQELVDGLKLCFADALAKFKQINGVLPSKIIMYRDGVGEGQTSAVVFHEIPQIQECFNSFGSDYKPQFAVVIVRKRITTRIMQMEGNRVDNPPPGALVNSHCTSHDSYEYFIVAQSVRQGTATPTNYHVVHDTSGLQPIHLQALTFKLAHLYYNWPGTVRVPAPCQYAHKIAFLIGQSVHKDPNLALADKLYFL